MATETKESNELQYKEAATQELTAVPSLDKSVGTLAKFGGFDFMEAIVDGVDSMNPGRKAKRNAFLNDTNKKEQREALKKKIQLWTDLLSESSSVSEMVDKAVTKAETAEQLLKGNLKKVLGSTRDLEQSYRSVHLFYKNTESPKLKNVVIMNAGMEKLTDLDEPRFIEYVAEELKSK